MMPLPREEATPPVTKMYLVSPTSYNFKSLFVWFGWITLLSQVAKLQNLFQSHRICSKKIDSNPLFFPFPTYYNEERLLENQKISVFLQTNFLR